MPQDYDLQIDGKSYNLNWTKPVPPTQADIEGIVAQYRAQAKQSAPPVTSAPKPSPPPTPAPAQPDRKAIDKFRMDFFNTSTTNAPKQAAEALAKNAADPTWLARVAKMNPISQQAIHERAQELRTEPVYEPPQNPGAMGAIGTYRDAQTGKRAEFGNIIPGLPTPSAIPLPHDIIGTMLHGPEGARQLQQRTGAGAEATRIAESTVDPESLAFVGALSGIGALGGAAAKLATGAAAGLGVYQGAQKLKKGDVGGAVVDVALGVAPIVAHGIGAKVKAARAAKALAVEAPPAAVPEPAAPNPEPIGIERGRIDLKPDAKVSPEVRAQIEDHNARLEARKAAGTQMPVHDPNFSLTEETPKAKPPESQSGTKTANEYVEGERKKYGLPPLPESKPDTAAAARERAFDKGMHEDALRVAEEIRSKPRAFTVEEQEANLLKKYEVEKNIDATRMKIEEQAAKGNDVSDYQAQHNSLLEDLNTLTVASKFAGTEESHALSFRSKTLDDDSYTNILQRMRVEQPQTPLTEVETKAAGAKAHEIKATDEALDTRETARDEGQSKIAVEQAHAELKKTVVRSKREAVKADLDAELDEHINRLVKKTTGQLNTLIDPTVVPIIKDIAVNRLKKGALTAEQWVDDVHAAIEGHPDLQGLYTKREIRDAISGYGYGHTPITTDLSDKKEQLRWVSKIEDIDHPLPKNAPRAVSDAVKALREQYKAANDKRAPEQKALDATQARVAAIQERLAGKVEAKAKLTTVDTEQMAKAKQDLTRLQRELAARQKAAGPAANNPYDTEQVKLRSQIREVQDRIKNNEVVTQKKVELTTVDTEETAAMKRELATEQKKLRAMKYAYKKSLRPSTDPFATYKKTLAKDIADLQRQVHAGQKDAPKTKAEKVYDAETQKLREQRERLRQDVRNMVRARTPKTLLEKYGEYHRAIILSRVTTLGKLGGAAFERALFTPVEEAAGKALHVVPGYGKVAAKAPHGTPSATALVEGGKGLFSKASLVDAAQKLKTGSNELDVMHNEKAGEMHDTGKTTLLNFFGRLHGAIKTPIQRATFDMSMKQQEAYEVRQGHDPTAPDVRAVMEARAYVKSKQSILMQDNAVVSLYSKHVIGALERSGTKSGKVVAAGLRAAMPIVKIPTNFAGEVGLHAAGVFRAGYELAMARGIDNLTPEQADIVVSALKKQAVGTALFAIGYYNADNMGGYYVKGGNRKNNLDPGSLRVNLFGHEMEVPHTFLHSPQIEVMTMGAAFRQAVDVAKGGKEEKLEAGAFRAAGGAAQLIPFIDAPMRAVKAGESPKSLGVFAGEEAASLTVPGLAPDIAGGLDKNSAGRTQKRKPRGFREGFEMGAGARKLVPTGR